MPYTAHFWSTNDTVTASNLNTIENGIQNAIVAVVSTQASTYTFVLADGGTVVESTSAVPVTWTIPPNSAVAFPIGAVIEVFQYGAGQVTFAAGAGVTIHSVLGNLKTTAQYSSVVARKRGTNEWVLVGDLSA